MKKLNLIVLFTILFCFCINSQNCFSAINNSSKKVPSQNVAKTTQNVLPFTNPLDIVANPTKYLNKKVRIKAEFDKFSVLGLDYQPAYKNSEKYITFLIKREDVINHVVPLSEMKNFILRTTAEKYIDLKPGDEIEYSGTVFSNALSDAWIDVDSFKVIKSKEKINK